MLCEMKKSVPSPKFNECIRKSSAEGTEYYETIIHPGQAPGTTITEVWEIGCRDTEHAEKSRMGYIFRFQASSGPFP